MSYASHKAGTIGRLLHFIHSYCPNWVADRVQFEYADRVTLHGKPFASYVWDEAGYPVFTFEDDWLCYINTQNSRRAAAIAECEAAAKLPVIKTKSIRP